jgi:hypothetical protein
MEIVFTRAHSVCERLDVEDRQENVEQQAAVV